MSNELRRSKLIVSISTHRANRVDAKIRHRLSRLLLSFITDFISMHLEELDRESRATNAAG
jgi:hypothetical protein